MNINLDIKSLILIITTACVLGGFYYTTVLRLNSLELKCSECKNLHHSVVNKVVVLEKEVNKLQRQVRNLKKNAK